MFTLALALDKGHTAMVKYLLGKCVNILMGDVIGLLLTRLSEVEASISQ
jgi:hypothetical protein